MDAGLDNVFRALADPMRRRILDLLRDQRRTTGELAAAFASEVSRFAVMKHLRVLETAGLVAVQRDGRRRYNVLNAAPLRMVHERWLSGYAELWARAVNDAR